MDNGVFQFPLFWLTGNEHVHPMFDIHGKIMAKQVMELFVEVDDVGDGRSSHSNFVQDEPPLAPPSLHCASPVVDIDMDGEESDEEYVIDNNDSGSSKDDDEEEFVPETLFGALVLYLLLAPQPISELSVVPSLYYTLDLDGIHKKTLFSNMGGDDYNIDGSVFKSREAIMQGMKNYSILRSTEYCVVEEVCKFGGPCNYLAPTISQDHRQFDNNLICSVILSLIQSNPSITIHVLQGAVRQRYHFKPSYKKDWMVKRMTIA
ncbi:hypothetical protein Ahy_A07g036570 [Arachis hypogaea]|uniref:Transposase MuDR plant domain-containing protein n=1 Tax=Arachis hypogaea TaxID=3818 RepID=A0A445CGG2_ARAHY|nr:hypothetical protein Ahy_A07g036570 [Arachis hypogaea]